VSLFKVVKYSSLLFFMGKYKSKLFRVVAVLLFALVTSLLYQDMAEYLQQQYPETVIYALAGKIVIVYGALVFVLLQFRPDPESGAKTSTQTAESPLDSSAPKTAAKPPPNDRLTGLEDVTKTATLRSRYNKVIESDKP
jgi:hypothetical protein